MNCRQVTSFAAALVLLALFAFPVGAEPVRIGFAVESVDYSPAFAAERLGLFKKAGIEVKLITFRGGAAAQEALSAGAADIIGYFSPAVALAVSKGAKERMVGTVSAGHVGWNVVVSANSPIKTIQDLAGKKVGVTQKATTSDMAALWVGEKANVKFQQIPLGGGGMVPALRSGQVDAIVLNLFSGLLAMRDVKNGQMRSVFDLTNEMPRTLSNVYVASQDMIDKRPDDLRATLAAIYEAIAYMKSNREWTEQFLRGYTKFDTDQLNDDLYNQIANNLSQDGRIEKKWVEDGLQIASRAWQMDALATVDPESLYTNAFLRLKN
jgi:NitT/TauT family transport system substrate-binding protein